MEFIGRVRELDYLEDLYSRGGSRCMIYGRRRIGKSRLINRFCEGKPAIIFNCTRGTAESKIEYMTDVLSEFTGRDIETPKTFYHLFKEMGEVCSEPGIVVVFDEFPYLIQDDEALPTEVQRFLDEMLDGTDTMVIVCGSSISVMEEQFTNPAKPLYGRFDDRLKLGPMSYGECASMHPRMSETDSMRLFMILGGVPNYHVKVRSDGFEEAVWSLFLKEDPLLGEEAEGMIRNELTNCDRHIAIVTAIAGGSTNLKEIHERTDIDEASCQKYIRSLERLGIVSRVFPMFNAPKRPLYRIEDNLMAFHYEVVARRRARIDPRSMERTMRWIGNDISTFLGKRFEDICAEYLRTNHHCLEVGKWWGKVGEDDSWKPVIGDIDVAAKVEQGDVVFDILGECKFTRGPAGFEALNQLMSRADLVSTSDNTRFVLFSWNGFTEELREFAEMQPDLFLVDGRMLLDGTSLRLMA